MYRDPKGFSLVTDGWGVETKEDTFACRHCQRIVFVRPRQDPNEFFCRGCMAPICPACANAPCEHFERKLERSEATDAWLRERFAEKLERASEAQFRREIDAALRREQLLSG
jgi:hypothetical protein